MQEGVKLGRERVGEGLGGVTHTLEVHGFHRFVHAFDYARHVACYLAHRYGRLDAASYGVQAAREAQQVQRLALLADCVGGVYPCAVVVALLQRLRTLHIL